MASLEQRVISIISQVSEIDPSQITSEDSFEKLNLTSLDAVTISYEIEQEFNIQIPDEQVYSIRTVHELINGIRQLTNIENSLE